MSIYKNASKSHLNGSNNYENFDVKRVGFEYKEVMVNKTPTPTIDIRYNYPGKGSGICYIQFHEVETMTGVFVKVSENGKETYKIGFLLDPENEKDARLIKILTQIQDKMYEYIRKMVVDKGKFQITGQTITDAKSVGSMFGFKFLIDHSEDPTKKMFYAKLMNIPYTSKSGAPGTMKAKFFYDTEDGEEDVEWRELMMQKFKCCPVIQLYRGYLGSTKSEQSTLDSALMTSEMTPAPKGSNQFEEARKVVKERDPNLGSKAIANLRALRNMKQDIKGIKKNSLWATGEEEKTLSSKKEVKEKFYGSSTEESEGTKDKSLVENKKSESQKKKISSSSSDDGLNSTTKKTERGLGKIGKETEKMGKKVEKDLGKLSGKSGKSRTKESGEINMEDMM